MGAEWGFRASDAVFPVVFKPFDMLNINVILIISTCISLIVHVCFKQLIDIISDSCSIGLAR